jgi:hypothetical protein
MSSSIFQTAVGLIQCDDKSFRLKPSCNNFLTLNIDKVLMYAKFGMNLAVLDKFDFATTKQGTTLIKVATVAA